MTLDEFQKEIYQRSLTLSNVNPVIPEDLDPEERYSFIEEIGDVLVFAARWAEALNTDLSTIANHSIDRLKMESEL